MKQKTKLILTALLVTGLFFMSMAEIVRLNIQYVKPAQVKLHECVKNTVNHKPCDLFFVAWPTPTPIQLRE